MFNKHKLYNAHSSCWKEFLLSKISQDPEVACVAYRQVIYKPVHRIVISLKSVSDPSICESQSWLDNIENIGFFKLNKS